MQKRMAVGTCVGECLGVLAESQVEKTRCIVARRALSRSNRPSLSAAAGWCPSYTARVGPSPPGWIMLTRSLGLCANLGGLSLLLVPSRDGLVRRTVVLASRICCRDLWLSRGRAQSGRHSRLSLGPRRTCAVTSTRSPARQDRLRCTCLRRSPQCAPLRLELEMDPAHRDRQAGTPTRRLHSPRWPRMGSCSAGVVGEGCGPRDMEGVSTSNPLDHHQPARRASRHAVPSSPPIDKEQGRWGCRCTASTRTHRLGMHGACRARGPPS